MIYTQLPSQSTTVADPLRKEHAINHLIIGNGVAGTTAAENIRRNDPDGAITILTEEDSPFYYRIRLNDYLPGDIPEPALQAKKERWYEELRITLKLKTRAAHVDPAKRLVTTEDGEALSYDRLLLASGSHAFIPPLKGADQKGVFAVRSLRDGRDIIAHAADVSDVVVIGGGLLGLEAGNAFRKMRKSVTVVEVFPRLLPRQLDQAGAARLQTIMEGMGFSFRLDARVEEIEGAGRVDGVRLAGGETLPAGMVIISAGISPNIHLAKAMGLECNRGIKVNDYLETGLPDIYAAGDAAEFRGIVYGIWPAAMEQGKIAGINMAGGRTAYTGTTMANTLKVAGIDLASAGDIDAENRHEAKTAVSDERYQKIVFEENRIIGCILLGKTTGFSRITRAITEKKDISGIKDKILSDGFDLNTI